MKKVSDNELLSSMESELAKQIPEADVTEFKTDDAKQNTAASMVGKKLRRMPGDLDPEEKKVFHEKVSGAAKVGDNLLKKAEFIDGWIMVDKTVLGPRMDFYPEDWQFKIRPATVEVIRNWSTLDETSFNSIDEVMNEILKSCVAITTNNGPIPWDNINSWDKFFFILLVREYTFIQGENNIEYKAKCQSCDNEVTFRLTSEAMRFDVPDADLLEMYDKPRKTWVIDPKDYDVDHDIINLYIPTVGKDLAIKQWLIKNMQEDDKFKADQPFIKFLPWLSPRLSKDIVVLEKQINDLYRTFKNWDIVTFSFMDEVLRNIIVTPSTKLVSKCEICGEEVESEIRFQDSIRSLFTVQNRFKKFGSK